MNNAALIYELEHVKNGSRALSKGMLRALGYRMTADGKGWMSEGGSRLSQRADPARNLHLEMLFVEFARLLRVLRCHGDMSQLGHALSLLHSELPFPPVNSPAIIPEVRTAFRKPDAFTAKSIQV